MLFSRTPGIETRQRRQSKSGLIEMRKRRGLQGREEENAEDEEDDKEVEVDAEEGHDWSRLEVGEDLDRGDRPDVHAAVDGRAAMQVEQEVAELASTPSGLAPVPLVSGADLITAGLVPGPGFGDLLDQLYDAQLEGRIETRSEGLAMAKSISF